MSIVPLILTGYKNNNEEVILWKNPAPCSFRWCRPFRMLNEKESANFVVRVMKEVQKEVDELVRGNFNGLPGLWSTFPGSRIFSKLQFEKQCIIHALNLISVEYEILLTMIDGKIILHLTNTTYTQRCYLCGLNGDDLNNIDGSRPHQINQDYLLFGLTPLHLWIRCLEFVLDIRLDSIFFFFLRLFHVFLKLVSTPTIHSTS